MKLLIVIMIGVILIMLAFWTPQETGSSVLMNIFLGLIFLMSSMLSIYWWFPRMLRNDQPPAEAARKIGLFIAVTFICLLTMSILMEYFQLFSTVRVVF